MKQILSIKVSVDADYDGDISDLGEYSNQPGPDDRTIDRKARGDQRHGEMRYFIVAMTGEETGNPDSPEEDYQRCEAYNRQEWCYMCVKASAQVRLTEHGPVQTIESGGIWGVESDSSPEYFREWGGLELEDLQCELEAIGFTTDEIELVSSRCVFQSA